MPRSLFIILIIYFYILQFYIKLSPTYEKVVCLQTNIRYFEDKIGINIITIIDIINHIKTTI
jgi:hypothetical protein